LIFWEKGLKIAGTSQGCVYLQFTTFNQQNTQNGTLDINIMSH